MTSLVGPVIKSLVFIVVTVLATVILATTIRSSSSGGPSYTALFTDATSLSQGDDVRMAGVRVGRVQSISVIDHRYAEVKFETEPGVPLNTGTVAQLKFRNLVGQRYLALNQGDGTDQMKAGATFGVDQTEPALDLTMLFNGFQPLFQLLAPDDVNKLSYQIVQVFQGEGTTVEGLLSSTARLTKTVASKDAVIGQLVDNLTNVLVTVNSRSTELSDTVVTLQQLVTGLAEDRQTIGSTLDGLGSLTTSVADLLDEGRQPLKRSIGSLGDLSKNLSDNQTVLEEFLQRTPDKLTQIGRLASYGSWVNTYLCGIDGRIPAPEGYVADVGSDNPAARCTA